MTEEIKLIIDELRKRIDVLQCVSKQGPPKTEAYKLLDDLVKALS